MHPIERQPIKVTRHMLLAAGALLGIASLPLAPVASCQTKSPNQAQRQSPMSPISDQKLRKTAVAVNQIDNLMQTYEQQLANARGAEKDRITKQANDAIVKAITDQGLSIDEYNEVIQAAHNDPAVRARLVQQAQQGQ